MKQSILELQSELRYVKETTTTLTMVKEKLMEQAVKRSTDALRGQEAAARHQAAAVRTYRLLSSACKSG